MNQHPNWLIIKIFSGQSQHMNCFARKFNSKIGEQYTEKFVVTFSQKDKKKTIEEIIKDQTSSKFDLSDNPKIILTNLTWYFARNEEKTEKAINLHKKLTEKNGKDGNMSFYLFSSLLCDLNFDFFLFG